jgi:hypothetical protein
METSLPTDSNRPITAERSGAIARPKFWYDERKLKVLGMATALPGPPVSTAQLLTRIEKRFDVHVFHRGTALAGRLRRDRRSCVMRAIPSNRFANLLVTPRVEALKERPEQLSFEIRSTTMGVGG